MVGGGRDLIGETTKKKRASSVGVLNSPVAFSKSII